MAELVTVARPYAKAAFQYALEVSQLDQWSEMLALLAGVAANEAMRDHLNNPRLTAEQLTAVFSEACGSRLSQPGKNLISQLAHNKRLAVLPVVNSLFQALLAEHRNSLDVLVSTAYELSALERSTLTVAMKKRLGKEVHLEAVLDKSLIGGVVIRAGDLVIDNSVRGKLQRLAKQINI